VREVDPTKDVVLVPLPFQIIETSEFAASVPNSWKKDTESPLFLIGDLPPFDVDAALSFQAFAFEKANPPLETFLKIRQDKDWKRKSKKPIVHAQTPDACMLTEVRGDQGRTVAVLRGPRIFLIVKLDYDGTVSRSITAQFRQVVESVVFR
jgi:hypothetical protein